MPVHRPAEPKGTLDILRKRIPGVQCEQSRCCVGKVANLLNKKDEMIEANA